MHSQAHAIIYYIYTSIEKARISTVSKVLSTFQFLEFIPLYALMMNLAFRKHLELEAEEAAGVFRTQQADCQTIRVRLLNCGFSGTVIDVYRNEVEEMFEKHARLLPTPQPDELKLHRVGEDLTSDVSLKTTTDNLLLMIKI